MPMRSLYISEDIGIGTFQIVMELYNNITKKKCNDVGKTGKEVFDIPNILRNIVTGLFNYTEQIDYLEILIGCV